ncbi:hypothetical protein WJX75_007031 [Coccomyxa subellipsoidea]|uniref:Protein kinase domain-containing protein n=1 Tax=Coccomyxa subellipsoidea TaxID=248742 RepID=A0ABR2Z4A8_9CHLO
MMKEIGAGAFATVDLCTYRPPTGGEVLVAVKRLRPKIIRNTAELRNFVQETKLLRKLHHKYITKYIGVGGQMDASLDNPEGMKEVLEHMYLVQEFLDGGNLRKQVLEQMCTHHLRKKHYSEAQALQWAIQIAKGLKYLHAAKPTVIWRDAKLENILMRSVNNGTQLEACLADFGLSKLLPRPGASMNSELRKCVEENCATGDIEIDKLSDALDSVLEDQKVEAEAGLDSPKSDAVRDEIAVFELTGKTGSYFYMAPEVVNEEPYNEKADVFSFGVILYEIFVGEITSQMVVGPTGDAMAAELYASKVAGGYRRPLPSFLPEKLRELIADCWAQDMHARPSMARALERLYDIESQSLLERLKEGILQKESVKEETTHEESHEKESLEKANGNAPAASEVGGPVGSAKNGCCIVM